MKKPRIAVVLAGSGARDGTEIHEAVMTLFGLARAGAEVECLCKDAPQRRVVNHLTGETMSETRNMLVESARIARGKVTDLAKVKAADFDGVVVVGGIGVPFNYCEFLDQRTPGDVDPTLERLLNETHAGGRPIGGVCVAPLLLAKVFGKSGCTVTLGVIDNERAAMARSLGANVVACRPEDCVVDARFRLVTTPAYMVASGVGELTGIWKLAEEVVRMALERTSSKGN